MIQKPIALRPSASLKPVCVTAQEVVIEWQGQEYGIWSENGMIRITRPEVPDESQIFKTSDAALDYMVGNDRLRDVITKVTVLDRTI